MENFNPNPGVTPRRSPRQAGVQTAKSPLGLLFVSKLAPYGASPCQAKFTRQQVLLRDMKEKQHDLKMMVEVLEQEFKNAVKKLAEAQCQAAAYERRAAKLEGCEEAKRILQCKVSAMEKTLASMRQKAEQHEREVSRQRARCQELERQLAAETERARQATDNGRMQLDGIQSQMADVARKAELAFNSKATLQRQLEQFGAQARQQAAQVQMLQGQLGAAQQAAQDKEGEAEELRTQVGELRSQLVSAGRDAAVDFERRVAGLAVQASPHWLMLLICTLAIFPLITAAVELRKWVALG